MAGVTVAFAAAALAITLLPASGAGADDPTGSPAPSAGPTSADAAAPTPEPSPTSTTPPTSPAPGSASPTTSPAPTDSASPSPSGNTDPTTVDDQARVGPGGTVAIAVLDNDTDADGDRLAVVQVGAPSLGSAQVVDDVVRYTADTGRIGTDSFTYTVTDGRGGTGTAAVLVTVRPDPVVRLRAPATPHVLRTYRISGAVPLDAGRPVVRVQRRAGERWVGTGQVEVRADGTFARRWRPQGPGVVRWRAVATWPDGDLAASQPRVSRAVVRLDPVVRHVTRSDVPHTWRPGCPVSPAQLRSIRMSYWDYRGRVRRGTLVGASWAVADYVAVFRAALGARFPIKKMYPADRYGGVDVKAMAAGNTSAFNCRHVTGNPYRLSQHSWGDAIDINTFENPYATGSRIYPAAAAVRYYHRRQYHLGDPGVITARSVIAQALFRRGWHWGARWANRDYQHWSRNGG
jgi:hypothetical protein